MVLSLLIFIFLSTLKTAYSACTDSHCMSCTADPAGKIIY